MSSYISVQENARQCRQLEKEIESLRSQVEDLTNDVESLIHKIVVVKQAADEYKRKYQILRINLTNEEYAHLCELWPELSPE